MLRTALIGLGYWGQRLLPKLQELTHLQTLITSRTSLAKDVAGPQVQIFDTLESGLNGSSFDAIFIATPIGSHYVLARNALEAGRHVFVEKPASGSSTRIEELSNLAASKQLQFAVGYQFVYSPCLQILYEAIDSPVTLMTSWLKTGSFDEKISDNLASHEFAVLQYLLGEPDSAIASPIEPNCSEDLFAAVLTWQMAIAHVYVNRVASLNRRALTLITESQTLEWCGREIRRLDRDNKSWNSIFESNEDLIDLEIRAFANSCASGLPSLTDGVFATSVARTLERLREQ